MDFEEQVYSVLILSAAEKFSTSFKNLLPSFRFHPVEEETSTSGAKRALTKRSYDYIVINDDLDTAVNDVMSIVRAEMLRKDKMMNIVSEVINNA